AVGPAAKAAVPALAEYATDTAQPAYFRATALETLGRIGPDAKPAVETVRGLLKDADTGVRFRAAEALAAVEGKSDETRAALLDLLKPEVYPSGYSLSMLVAALDA